MSLGLFISTPSSKDAFQHLSRERNANITSSHSYSISISFSRGKDKVNEQVSITERLQERHFRAQKSPTEIRCHSDGGAHTKVTMS